jgi:hypothetical protein
MIVQPPDMELWLTNYLRHQLAGFGQADVEVGNKEPAKFDGTSPLVVIRSDGPTPIPPGQFDMPFGVSVLAGTRQNDQQASALAHLVFAVLTADPDIALADHSPISAVLADGCNGPYLVNEPHNVSRRYMTTKYRVIGVQPATTT